MLFECKIKTIYAILHVELFSGQRSHGDYTSNPFLCNMLVVLKHCIYVFCIGLVMVQEFLLTRIDQTISI